MHAFLLFRAVQNYDVVKDHIVMVILEILFFLKKMSSENFRWLMWFYVTFSLQLRVVINK